MQQNYEDWYRDYARSRAQKVRNPTTYVPATHTTEERFVPTYDITTDIAGAYVDLEVALKTSSDNPFREISGEISELPTKLPRSFKNQTQKSVTDVLLYSLFLQSQKLEDYEVGFHAKQLSEKVSSLQSSATNLGFSKNTSLTKISEDLSALEKKSYESYKKELPIREAELNDAKEQINMVGIGGSILSGIVMATATVLAIVVASTPVGWGILGSIAAAGLAGLIGSAIYGYFKDNEIDRIDNRIDDLKHGLPEGYGEGYPEVNLVTDVKKSPEEDLSKKLEDAMVALETFKTNVIHSLYQEYRDKNPKNVTEVSAALGKRMITSDHSQDKFLVEKIQEQRQQLRRPELSEDTIKRRLNVLTDLAQVQKILLNENLGNARERYNEGTASIPDKQVLVQAINAVNNGVAQAKQQLSSAETLSPSSQQKLGK